MVRADLICKKYKSKEVLHNASIEAAPGSITAIVGKNGCGKTTLLKILSGVIEADSGEISYFGHSTEKNKGVFGKYCGYVPQDNPLLEELTVKDNINFWASSVEKPDMSLIEKFNLNDIMNEKVANLSGGMKRRLAITCIMLRKTPVIILDEPTSSLDLSFQDSIMQSLIDFKNRNGTVIFSTHNPFEIELSDVCYLFDDTEIIRYNKQDINIELIKNTIANNGNK